MKKAVDMKHSRSQSEHEDSGIVSHEERRGVRSMSFADVFSDCEEYLFYDRGYSETHTYGSLFGVANDWLKSAGEKDFCGIVEDAVAAKKNAKTQREKDLIDRLNIERRWFEIGVEHGFLSPAAIAAKFLATSDLVHRLAKGNKKLQRAIYKFADAWHWMHFEAKGEHEKAEKNIRGRAKGPEVRRERGHRKKTIVKEIYEEFASDETNGHDRSNAERAAFKLLEKVNKKLLKDGIQKMALKSLTDQLRPLVKERFPKQQ